MDGCRWDPTVWVNGSMVSAKVSHLPAPDLRESIRRGGQRQGQGIGREGVALVRAEEDMSGFWLQYIISYRWVICICGIQNTSIGSIVSNPYIFERRHYWDGRARAAGLAPRVYIHVYIYIYIYIHMHTHSTITYIYIYIHILYTYYYY